MTPHDIDRSDGAVFVIREHGEPVWRVEFQGQVCAPRWRERGPAEAYLDGLRRGRKPEVRSC